MALQPVLRIALPAALLLGILSSPTPPRAAAPPAAAAPPTRLVVLSTSDMKGKTGPCGCHIPKGGFARLASYADSARLQYGPLLLVTTGGFFPEEDEHEPVAAFFLDAFHRLGFDAVGVSEKELRYGRGFLLACAKRSQAPLTCANLLDKSTRLPLVAPYVIRKVGGVTVGILALTSDHVDLGSLADSVTVEAPELAARRVVGELRARGATVVVLLSELGKVESEDLVTAIDGIDVVVTGRNVPVLQVGRMIKNTVACYGGEQGQYVGRTLVTLDGAKRMATGENEVYTLSPEVGDQPAMLALVKQFEDAFGEQKQLRDKERAALAAKQRASATQGGVDLSADHYVGAEFCRRCHPAEYAQWQGSPHAHAWQALVDTKRDASRECQSCHVTGFQQPGGFKTGEDAAKSASVQCEDCHGMGTSHQAWPATKTHVAASVCTTCHTATVSPGFAFEKLSAYVDHAHAAGSLPALPVKPMHAMGGKAN